MTNTAPSENLPIIHDGIIDPPHDVEVLSADEFKLAFRNHPAGVAIVTADAGKGPVAMTSSVFLSVLSPLLVFSASASPLPRPRSQSSTVFHLLGLTSRPHLAATSGATVFPRTFRGRSSPLARLFIQKHMRGFADEL
jgi:hypothetical protein